ncbi:MAG TPA: type II toxin-antitoxin system HicB family antitoxin [Anaerolineae bacterium]|nr:type II toxin-antitoxin system HicB family antitoxin [Anaerolineae bacterium]HNU04370.1 type II toxin-antitoxin system HicB family antitoxin [Anaerolineae bacterium]
MRSYLAFIHKDPDSDYTVTFPDFPGCITAGATLDEARDMAREALPFHVEGLAADGEALPDPMSLEQALTADPMGRDAVAFLVDVPIDDPIVRANITMPRGILERIDRHARAQGLSRSAFLAQAAQRAMQQGS